MNMVADAHAPLFASLGSLKDRHAQKARQRYKGIP